MGATEELWQLGEQLHSSELIVQHLEIPFYKSMHAEILFIVLNMHSNIKTCLLNILNALFIIKVNRINLNLQT